MNPNHSSEPRGAIVTGSASGLGRAMAVRLARDGWRIALADVDERGNNETLAQVEAAGATGCVEHLDVADSNSWENLIERLQSDWPQLDLLVNNAGVASSGEVGEHSLEDWDWIVRTNLFGAIHGCHFALPWMKRNPHRSHLVNVSSIAAIMCSPSMAAYNVTKAGILALSETLYSELQPNNIGVTVVCPGFVETNILQGSRYRSDAQKQYAAEAMQKSRFSADDLAQCVMAAISRNQLYLFAPGSARRDWWNKRLMPQRYLARIGRGFRQLFSCDQNSQESP